MHHTFEIFYSNLESTLQTEDKSKIPVMLEFEITLEENPTLVTTTSNWTVPPLKQKKIAAALQVIKNDDWVKASLVRELGLLNSKNNYCPKFKINKRGLSDAIEFSRDTFGDHMHIICDPRFNWEHFALSENPISEQIQKFFKQKISRHDNEKDPYQFRFFECDVLTVPDLGTGLYVAKSGWLEKASFGKYQNYWVGLVKNAKHLIIPVIY